MFSAFFEAELNLPVAYKKAGWVNNISSKLPHIYSRQKYQFSFAYTVKFH